MRVRSWVAFVASLLLVGCAEHHDLLAPRPALTELPSHYSVEYDPVLQTPRFVRNSHALGMARPGAPGPYDNEEAFRIVREFVVRYAPVFHFRPGVDDFTIYWAEGHDGENLVKIQQTYEGFEVLGMGYGTSVLPNGEVGSMIGRFLPDIHVLTMPLITPEVAATKSVAALLPTIVTARGTPRLVVDVTETFVPRLAWSTVVQSTWPSWTVLVDAQTGEVLAVGQNWIDG